MIEVDAKHGKMVARAVNSEMDDEATGGWALNHPMFVPGEHRR